jgi:hypothetical protein
MHWLDRNDSILAWASEEVVVPYVFQDKVRRYFVDFWIRTDKETLLVEVKPKRECLAPKRGRGRPMRLVESENVTFLKNQAKWKAAEQYAKSQGWRFWVWDEVTLGHLGVVV